MPKKAENGPVTAGDSQGMTQGITVLSYLIAGVAFYGVLGWLADRFFDTSFLLPLGIVLGAAGGIYLTIKRFGGTADATPAAPPAGGEEERWDR